MQLDITTGYICFVSYCLTHFSPQQLQIRSVALIFFWKQYPLLHECELYLSLKQSALINVIPWVQNNLYFAWNVLLLFQIWRRHVTVFEHRKVFFLFSPVSVHVLQNSLTVLQRLSTQAFKKQLSTSALKLFHTAIFTLFINFKIPEPLEML